MLSKNPNIFCYDAIRRETINVTTFALECYSFQATITLVTHYRENKQQGEKSVSLSIARQ